MSAEQQKPQEPQAPQQGGASAAHSEEEQRRTREWMERVEGRKGRVGWNYMRMVRSRVDVGWLARWVRMCWGGRISSDAACQAGEAGDVRRSTSDACPPRPYLLSLHAKWPIAAAPLIPLWGLLFKNNKKVRIALQAATGGGGEWWAKAA